jgi:hypothetical protein
VRLKNMNKTNITKYVTRFTKLIKNRLNNIIIPGIYTPIFDIPLLEKSGVQGFFQPENQGWYIHGKKSITRYIIIFYELLLNIKCDKRFLTIQQLHEKSIYKNELLHIY